MHIKRLFYSVFNSCLYLKLGQTYSREISSLSSEATLSISQIIFTVYFLGCQDSHKGHVYLQGRRRQAKNSALF